LSFSSDEPDLKGKVKELTKPSPPQTVKPPVINEPPLGPSTVKILIEHASMAASKIELLKLYQAALSIPSCPMSPALSNFILDMGLNHEDTGVRRAARDVVIKTLSHDTILPAWDANRDGDVEELTTVAETCLQVASDASREHEIRYDAFVVAEKIITRMPEVATDPVRALLTSLGLLKNHQLADKAKVLLYYIDEQVKDEKLKDAASALRNLTAQGKAIELSAAGYKS
jgi:hypothetical protein